MTSKRKELEKEMLLTYAIGCSLFASALFFGALLANNGEIASPICGLASGILTVYALVFWEQAKEGNQ